MITYVGVCMFPCNAVDVQQRLIERFLVFQRERNGIQAPLPILTAWLLF